jgi:GNAT superfamily N-acetyltransferase
MYVRDAYRGQRIAEQLITVLAQHALRPRHSLPAIRHRRG